MAWSYLELVCLNVELFVDYLGIWFVEVMNCLKDESGYGFDAHGA
jgi:hypothetical protein